MRATTMKMVVRTTRRDGRSGRGEGERVGARRRAGRELERERRDTRGSSRVYPLPVVGGTMVIVVKAGEQMQCGHPFVEERGVVAAAGTDGAGADFESGNL